MTRYLVKYDLDSYTEESFEDEDGETIYEEYHDSYSDELEIEADDEHEARREAYERLYGEADDINVWSVEPLD